eukprot:c10723_g1_i1.p1 GENE.c10723_g1_i1~~c10723_g1_i1.p1  ORF type:complete len:709 (+),score=165.53 c10723_g1_i1:76-2127(+)
MYSELNNKKFDLVVAGTGLVEDIVAAAAAVVGKKVLHMDAASSYGAEWATCCLQDLWDSVNPGADQPHSDLPMPPAALHIATSSNSQLVVSPTPAIQGFSHEFANENVRQALERQSRRYWIDLNPRLMHARGDMVETVVRAKCTQYQNFQLLDQILMYQDSGFQRVPLSKGDVFSSGSLTLLEKRMLMRLMTQIGSSAHAPQSTRTMDQDVDLPDNDARKGGSDGLLPNELFREYLARQKLTDKLRIFVMYALALAEIDQNSPSAMSAEEGINRIRRLLYSLGRYGDSPFLVSMYGAGDYAQSFVRLAAVHEATYVLRYLPKALELHENESITSDPKNPSIPTAAAPTENVPDATDKNSENLETQKANLSEQPLGRSSYTDEEGNHVTFDHVLLGSSMGVAEQTDKSSQREQFGTVYRWAGITTRSLCDPLVVEQGEYDLRENISSLLIIPPNSLGNTHTVHVMQFSSKTAMCPDDRYVVHMTTVHLPTEPLPNWSQITNVLFTSPPPTTTAPQQQPPAETDDAQTPATNDNPETLETEAPPAAATPPTEPVAAPSSSSGAARLPVPLLWQCSFTQPASAPIRYSATGNDADHARASRPFGPNVPLWHADAPSVGSTADDAVIVAQRIFSEIFPGVPFIPVREDDAAQVAANDSDEENAIEPAERRVLNTDYQGNTRVVVWRR